LRSNIHKFGFYAGKCYETIYGPIRCEIQTLTNDTLPQLYIMHCYDKIFTVSQLIYLL